MRPTMATDYVLRRAAAQYERDGTLSLDMMAALENAGLIIEDVINHLETLSNV